jgi:hypothetical protein
MNETLRVGSNKPARGNDHPDSVLSTKFSCADVLVGTDDVVLFDIFD